MVGGGLGRRRPTGGSGPPEGVMPRPLNVLLVEQAGRTSNEWELFAAMRDVHLTVASNRGGWNADEEIVVPTLSLPGLDSSEAWTMAPTWLRQLDRRAGRDIDVVVSLEVF